MFNFFRKKSELEKLEIQFNKLLEEWHQLSKTNRKLSDEKYAMAQELVPLIEELKKKS